MAGKESGWLLMTSGEVEISQEELTDRVSACLIRHFRWLILLMKDRIDQFEG